MTMLEVDLGTKTSKKTDVSAVVKDRSSGNGLGLKLLWDRVPAGTDGLDAKNIFHIGTGPLTGLIGCKTSCTFKSPLVDWAGEATLSSEFGLEIVQAGYNCGILLTGKAAAPSYVLSTTTRLKYATPRTCGVNKGLKLKLPCSNAFSRKPGYTLLCLASESPDKIWFGLQMLCQVYTALPSLEEALSWAPRML